VLDRVVAEPERVQLLMPDDAILARRDLRHQLVNWSSLTAYTAVNLDQFGMCGDLHTRLRPGRG
jgi:hypothetical protein